MFEKQLTLFELLGFKVKVDVTWLFLALLVTWSLARGVFPYWYEGLERSTYWWMGVAGVLGLFFSIIFHELSHSVVARRYGLQIKGITLFIFGGVAEMEDEPPSAKSEFLMAIAGPIASALLAAGFHVVYVVGQAQDLPDPVLGVVRYLGLINAVLAAFNLVPAFPLDGGRALRAAIWHWKGDLKRATYLATRMGLGFGLVLIVLGFFNVLAGDFVGGMWWFLIGLFLRGAANASWVQLRTRRALEGEPVSRFMKQDPVTVTPDATIVDLVDDYVYRYHHSFFPVTQDDRLIGYISTRDIKQVPREKWNLVTVGDAVVPCTSENTVRPDEDAVRALSIMRRSGNSRLMVTSDDHLLGIITLKDMMKLLDLKMDLEDAP